MARTERVGARQRRRFRLGVGFPACGGASTRSPRAGRGAVRPRPSCARMHKAEPYATPPAESRRQPRMAEYCTPLCQLWSTRASRLRGRALHRRPPQRCGGEAKHIELPGPPWRAPGPWPLFHFATLVDGVVFQKTTPEPLGGESGEARPQAGAAGGGSPRLHKRSAEAWGDRLRSPEGIQP